MPEHREVPHIRRQEVGVDDDRGRRDQVVDSTDAAVALSVPTSRLPGDASHIFGDFDPMEGGAELFNRGKFLAPSPRQEFESDELACQQVVAGVDQRIRHR